MTGELYKTHRPQDFSGVVGQREAVASLCGMAKTGKFPHSLLFTGPSGCGKTTLARIVRRRLRCADADYQEINAADDRGIDTVRSIQDRVGLAPMAGPCRVWVIDEAHQLTTQAQDAFLKLLEDTPAHVYFQLATTDPQKLKKTIVTRCTEVRVRLLTTAEMEGLLQQVAQAEGRPLPAAVAAKITEIAEGSARKGLVLLNQVLGLATEEQQMEALQKADVHTATVELCRLLLKGAPWKQVAPVLRGLEEEPETVRRMVLGYMRSVALGAGPQTGRAMSVLESFLDPFYDSGAAGLAHACFVACGGK